MKKRIILIVVLLLAILGIGYVYTSIPMIELEKNAEVEINSTIDPYDYITKYRKCEKEDVSIDSSQVDLTKIGEYTITYTVKDEIYDLPVKIVDTTAPIVEVKDKEIFEGDHIKVEDLVSKVEDATEAKVTFKEDYDFSKEGTYKVIVVAEDSSENITEKEVNVKVVKDKEKPTLKGVSNKTIYLNNKINYLDGITAKDNRDKEPEVTVDSSEVDTSKIGTYTVKYRVKDQAGNTNEYTSTINVIEKKKVQNVTASGDKIVYLTFDDGPSDNTAKILKILDQYNAKATFFVTGNNQKYNYLITKAHNAGHTIGLHTYSHDYSIYSSVDTYFNDLNKIGSMVKGLTGEMPKYIRFPGGSSNTVSKKYCKGIMSTLVIEVQNRGYQYYDWNVSSEDASGNNVAKSRIVKASTSSSAKNINLLMHDTSSKDTTVQALPEIIEYYQSKGYVFKAITDSSYTPHHGVNN